MDASNRDRLSSARLLVAGLLAFAALLAVPAGASAQFADDFADTKYEFSSKDWWQWGVIANLEGATKEPGEPDHAGSAGGGSLWFEWTSYEDGEIQLEACGGTGDSVLGVYTGTAVDELTEIASNDDSDIADHCGAAGGSALQTTVTKGTVYKIAVGSKGPDGWFRVDLNYLATNDDFENATVLHDFSTIHARTRRATLEPGEPSHPGGWESGSVWYEWTAEKSGPIVLSNCGGWPWAAITVYSGATLSSLQQIASGVGSASVCAPNGETRFQAVEGQTYEIAVLGDPGRAVQSLSVYWGWVGTRELTLTTSGSGSGRVVSNPLGIDCGSSCEAGFLIEPSTDDWRSRATLTAIPAPGSVFTGWSGANCSGAAPSCALVIDKYHSADAVNANFELLPPVVPPPSLLPAPPAAAPPAHRKRPKCVKRRVHRGPRLAAACPRKATHRGVARR